MTAKSKENRIPQLSARALKWIACICMLADHTAKCFSLKGISFFLLSDLIGRITFPVFCMLLAEGFFHTRSRLRYIFRVLVLALLSELPYDLVLQEKIWDWSAQNTCFTLLLGLLMFSLLEMVRMNQNLDYRISAILQMSIIAVVAVSAFFLRADYQANGIAALALFYYSAFNSQGHRSVSGSQKHHSVSDTQRHHSVSDTQRHHSVFDTQRHHLAFDTQRHHLAFDHDYDSEIETKMQPLSPEKRGTTAAAACLCLNVYQFYNAGAFLSVLPLSMYNGRRGAITRAGQYAFYLFYPLHLLFLLLIRCYAIRP